MGVLYGAMYICDSCGNAKFIKVVQEELANNWELVDRKLLCSDCLEKIKQIREEDNHE